MNAAFTFRAVDELDKGVKESVRRDETKMTLLNLVENHPISKKQSFRWYALLKTTQNAIISKLGGHPELRRGGGESQVVIRSGGAVDLDLRLVLWQGPAPRQGPTPQPSPTPAQAQTHGISYFLRNGVDISL